MTHRPLVLAHRGACRRAPENTIAAFAAARALGADGVELDVRRTADGVLVVHHDPAIDGLGVLANVPFARLRAGRPDIPTLAEALEACRGMLVNVEVKCLPWEPDADADHVAARGSVDLVRDHGADAVFSSFDLATVDAVRAYAPGTETGFLVYGQDVDAAAALASERGHGWLHPERAAVVADLDAIARCHDRGLRVDVWTVDDPADIVALASAGVDAIITNVPDGALAALDRG